MLKFAPTGKCPSLHDGKVAVWESLAIIEYVAEAYPDKAIWPRSKAARAHARALANEMHAGFGALRQACPTNFRRPVRGIALGADIHADVARIEAAWAQAREMFGKGGSFLFGRFSAADAMFAPVVNRFHVYDIPVSGQTRAYMASVMALPAWKAWIAGAEAEPWRIERYEAV
jgi:glutathione S-transferase